MRCPRCHRDTGDAAPAFCRACGAPLRLDDEPRLRPLDAPLPLDRREGQRAAPAGTLTGILPAEATPPVAPGARLSELAALDRSRWDLGRETPAGRPEPAPRFAGPAAPAPEAAPDLEVEVDAVEVRLRRPATWRRVAAGAVDALPFAAGGAALARALLRDATGRLPAPPAGVDGALDLVAGERVIVVSVAALVVLALAVYATLAHALAGATLGKWLLGLRLVGPDGARPSPSRSAARTACAVLSGALLGLGFLAALFTRSGRALHDLLARTWVVEAP